ncbi:hypothetical protein TNCV_3558701 [Trichonephila clavipes]|uniref:Uncharacterized protein n=1 Tax=Trichonephila clavipes TaxID=2585209 RepID=A0A8X6WCB3_TRICX|nr:hypothetical protein TNCV_3558701 [Trichonephila clavipes]
MDGVRRIDNEPLLTPKGVKAVPVVTPIIVYDATGCIKALRTYGGTQIFGQYSHFRNIGVALMHNSKQSRAAGVVKRPGLSRITS